MRWKPQSDITKLRILSKPIKKKKNLIQVLMLVIHFYLYVYVCTLENNKSNKLMTCMYAHLHITKDWNVSFLHRNIGYRWCPKWYWAPIIDLHEYRQNFDKISKRSAIYWFRGDPLAKNRAWGDMQRQAKESTKKKKLPIFSSFPSCIEWSNFLTIQWP